MYALETLQLFPLLEHRCVVTLVISPSPPLDNIQLMSSSYRSNRFGLSHWDPYAVYRVGYLELYYCRMVGVVLVGFKPDLDDQLVFFSALTLLVWSSGL